MDKNHFRKITNPNLYADYKNVNNNSKQFSIPMESAPDNRYEGWVAQMSDGRLTTDYGNHCSRNIPAGQQFPTKAWLQRNGDKVIEFSRNNQLPVTKSLDASVIPPPAQLLTAEKYESSIKVTNNSLGIGIERANSGVPELFGTFGNTTFQDKPQNSRLTKHCEGGRNTPRGTYSNINNLTKNT